jgi:hypothetical protein
VKAIPAAANKKAIFAWGDRIFVPSGATLEKWLVDHESVHGLQQLQHPGSIEGWWTQYLEDPVWRVMQELPAHVAEYRGYCKKCADQNKRAKFLMDVVADRLASPFYGSLLTHDEAIKVIREHADAGKKKRDRA